MKRLLLLAALLCALPSFAADDFSPAERAIFMSNQLGNVKPPATLRYRYVKAGTLEPGFDDTVQVALKARPDKTCCAAAAEFLTGERRLALPEVEAAEGNPVVLYFLERDIREMQRLTKGQANYFRKRIRMAIYQGATIRDVQVTVGGRSVAAREITITPYTDDPNAAKFTQYLGKRYVFTLSDAVPGGVVSIATRVDGATLGTPALWTEDMSYVP